MMLPQSQLLFVGGVVIAIIGLLHLLNWRRNTKFETMSKKFGLDFQKMKIPNQFKADQPHVIRRLSGVLAGLRIDIIDIVMHNNDSSWYFSRPRFLSLVAPEPLFGTNYTYSVRTEMRVNGKFEKHLFSDVSVLAPGRMLNRKLANIGSSVPKENQV